MSSADTSTKPSLTFITCIESGMLEHDVPLMVKTLRRFGGRFADCPVIAVSPREVGLPLLAETRKSLDELGVELIERNVRHRYRWWGFMNKPTGLVLVAPHLKTKDAVWIDGDVLVARPPEEFGRHPDVDVLASVEEQGPVSTGPDSPFDSFYAKLAEVIGMPLEQLPWVTRPWSKDKIRIYFNSGVFRYPVGCGLEEMYLRNVERLLDAKVVAKTDPSIFLHEQICFGLSVAKLGLSFLELGDNYNFHTEESYEKYNPVSAYKDVTLFHYHRGLRGSYRPKLISQLRETFPELAEIVESYHPHNKTRMEKVRTIPRRLLYEVRKWRCSKFSDRCVRV